MSNQIYALLVGIDRYANPRQAPHLRGCVADVEGNYNWLVTKMGIPPENIRLLTATMDQREPPDRLATRANIIQGWREHLAQADEGDQVFFNYSGHGAQARSFDPKELDGYDETLVAHDSRASDANGNPIYDILDKELAQLIREVEERDVQVTVFMDCCHSGGGTRMTNDGDEDAPRSRQCAADERERPLDTLIAGFDLTEFHAILEKNEESGASTRSVGDSTAGWVALGNHVLLAGCRDEELANEYRSPETGQWQGATTYFFHKAMAHYRPGMTWAEVHDFIETHVHQIYPTQTPQIEGPGNLEIFGGLAKDINSYLLVTETEGNYVKINGGVAIGLSKGAQVAIFAPGSDMSGEPLANATIDELKADFAWGKLDRTAEIAQASRVKIVAYGFNAVSHIVQIDDEMVSNAVANVADGSPSPFLEVVTVANTSATPEFVVNSDSGEYVISDASGVQIVDETPPVSEEGAATVAGALEHLAVYRNTKMLRNPTPDSALRGAITISEPVLGHMGRGSNIVEEGPVRRFGNEYIVDSEDTIVFTVRNNSTQTLYVAVLYLDANFGISRYFPERNRYETMPPGQEISFDVELFLDNPRLPRATESFKVFATTETTSFDVLQMPELNKGDLREGPESRNVTVLGELLNGARHHGTRPARRPRRDDTDDTWTTEQIDITILGDNKVHALPEGQTTVALEADSDMSIEKPSGFGGSLSISSMEQSTRSVGGSHIPLPPGFSNSAMADTFRPLGLGESTRSVGQTPMIMNIDANQSQLDSITDENPLKLSMDLAAEENLVGVLPIAYDGTFYHVVGAGAVADEDENGKRVVSIDINQLPADTGGSSPADDPAGTRGIIRTARLYFYKVFLHELPKDTGVRKAEIDENGDVVYSPVTPEEIQQANQIALFIHGFTSYTKEWIKDVWPIITDLSDYDLCLAYDYETFATGIRKNGETLANTLKTLGFGENSTLSLDIYAHSMGTQVSRALVELFDGDAYVNRVFMGGPPNGGSVLAKAGRFLPWLATVAANFAEAIPAEVVVAMIIDNLSKHGSGLMDLAPDSAFYQEINDESRPLKSVPYYIQIGNNTEKTVADWRVLSKAFFGTLDVGLDRFFDDENDVAVAIHSAKDVYGGRWPNLTIEELSVNHFRYFFSDEGKAILEKWLAA
ncbi:MAG: caspase family protein [Chloroflexota bacterium]